MKKHLLYFAALALAFCSCNNNNSNGNSDQTQNNAQPIMEEEVLSATGDLNHDGLMDSIVIAKKEVYHNLDDEVEPVEGDGLKIFFGDEKGDYSLFHNYAINNHPEELYANWDSIIIYDDGYLTIMDHFRSDDDNYYTYGIWFRDNDFYLTDFTMEYGTDEYNMQYYDMVDNRLKSYIEWHEMDSENYHHRTDWYDLKDIPQKSLSEFKIGDMVCDFNEYVEQIDEDIFEFTGTSKEELCPAEFNPTYEEADLNHDGINDLIINVNNARFAIYFRNSDGDYNFEFEGKSCDEWTEISAYEKDGNLMVYAFTESSKLYTFHYDDNGYCHLLSFEQSMYWPDGGGSYFQFIDFVNGKRTEQVDEEPDVTVDIPQRPLSVIEEFHFGNVSEIEDLIED